MSCSQLVVTGRHMLTTTSDPHLFGLGHTPVSDTLSKISETKLVGSRVLRPFRFQPSEYIVRQLKAVWHPDSSGIVTVSLTPDDGDATHESAGAIVCHVDLDNREFTCPKTGLCTAYIAPPDFRIMRRFEALRDRRCSFDVTIDDGMAKKFCLDIDLVGAPSYKNDGLFHEDVKLLKLAMYTPRPRTLTKGQSFSYLPLLQ